MNITIRASACFPSEPNNSKTIDESYISNSNFVCYNKYILVTCKFYRIYISGTYITISFNDMYYENYMQLNILIFFYYCVFIDNF